MNLVEIVLLSNDVQYLGGILSVVGGVPLSNVFDPEIESNSAMSA
jgi:hypothetical protein